MKNDLAGSPDHNLDQEQDVALDQALKNFRSSVHAWSEAAYSRPHVPAKIYRTSWRMATAWTLGCVLVSGSVAGGLFERHHRQDQARIAAASDAARQQRLVEQQRIQKENE